MFLEDVLAILGRAGTVKLRKGTNDRSATPGHQANTEGWTCEITLRGYLMPWGHGGLGGSTCTLISRGRDLAAIDAARDLLEQVETFLEGPDGERCRACYLEQHKVLGRGEPAPTVSLEVNL